MTGVAVEKLLPPKSAKIESHWAVLQTTFFDENWMHRSAPVRVRAVGIRNLSPCSDSQTISASLQFSEPILTS
jgi:hypothetical protein